jgi:geranylgeranyl pyrophosphate synthase
MGEQLIPVPGELLLKADDQILQVARLFRKAEAYEQARDILADIDSIEHRIKDLEKSRARNKAEMELSLQSSKQTLQQLLRRLFERVI